MHVIQKQFNSEDVNKTCTNRHAIVLLNMGGPDSLDDVEGFLIRLFSDPFIFKLPIQKLLARMIAKFRLGKAKKQYEQIGGKSPIHFWTEQQRASLEQALRQIDPYYDVFIAMRYSQPFIQKTASFIHKQGYGKITLLSLYPQYSKTTTESSFCEWEKQYQGSGLVCSIKSFFENDLYIQALNARIEETLLKFPYDERKNVHLVFSAHGLPKYLIKHADPYLVQIQKTVENVMKHRGYLLPYSLCFQSKVGFLKWLEPSIETQINDLANKGCRNLLIIPISFVSDHIETLFELDIFYRHIAQKAGVKFYHVMEGLNDSKLFIKALVNLVIGDKKI